jgi:O-antigen ligase
MHRPKQAPRRSPESQPAGDDDFAAIGEWLRKLALGLTAALLTARAFYPSEPDLKLEGGPGLGWALAVLAAFGLALLSALIGGTLRIRWSWTDAAAIVLFAAVGASTMRAADFRTAVNLGWQWAAVGIAFLLVRNLPRSRNESMAIAAALMATAVAVSVYGLYQVGVELPPLRAAFQANRALFLRRMNIAPGSPAETLLANRLLGSKEPFSTFALTNSLAGFLVGPMVLLLDLAWRNLRTPAARGSRVVALAMASLPALALAVCLLLTKSRSAYVGLAVALGVLAWRERKRVRLRTIVITAFAGLAVLIVLIGVGLRTGNLDRLVLTESTKSLRYRSEYWTGAWRIITQAPNAFWRGVGPGNFGWSYVRYKLPQASEEISDPHNMVLEAWTTAGVVAATALVVALVFALRDLLGPSRLKAGSAGADIDDRPPSSSSKPAEPWSGSSWLIAASGAGWLVVVLIGGLNPFEGDSLARWLVLAIAWLSAVMFGQLLWRRVPVEGSGFGLAALAVMINLLAAGGIGIPTVALALWTLLALGLNLRDDRPCGQLRVLGHRGPAFGVSIVFAALAGSFYGSVMPFWRSERAIAEAEGYLAQRKPNFAAARAAFLRAADPTKGGDMYSSRPWLGLAYLELYAWKDAGERIENNMWRAVPVSLLKATEPPRNTKAWTTYRDEAMITRDLLRQIGSNLAPTVLVRFHADIARAARKATELYPSNAGLHALLAEASADVGMMGEAVKEAEEALRLDALMPHLERKLPAEERKKLQDAIPVWRAAANKMPPVTP